MRPVVLRLQRELHAELVDGRGGVGSGQGVRGAAPRSMDGKGVGAQHGEAGHQRRTRYRAVAGVNRWG